MLQQVSLARVDHGSTAIDISNPKVIAAAAIFKCTPSLMVANIEVGLESPVSRSLYLSMDVHDNEARLMPKHFRELMVAFLGREPNAQDITSIPDPHYRNVSTSGATRLLDEYLQDVFDLLDDTRAADIPINHRHAAWLVITFYNREGALAKLEELSQKYRPSKKLIKALNQLMLQTPIFKELAD